MGRELVRQGVRAGTVGCLIYCQGVLIMIKNLRMALGKEVCDGFAEAVLGGVEGAFFDLEGGSG